MADNLTQLVLRKDKVAYWGVGTGPVTNYNRMQGFTSLPTSRTAEVYGRKYVDEPSQRTDTVGINVTISYAFDEYKGNLVQEDIISITEKEVIGEGAVREIVQVDFSQPITGSENTFKAIKRRISVAPSGQGDGTMAYAYAGVFNGNGTPEEGQATVQADGLTCTFTIPTT